ncbi:flagellar hook-associated protein FlgK [Desulfitobacterium dichloroeliminans LMG P-21439]|uniref:Flagellar hook-associated protein 1 n=1 Tax=Desulfitobacterium dichloroeliminans (strain LMG P-21439 / DCA1) TaxID=871963 RepID=L0FCD9_DESDL|nr:flagellar hook-associated protein FlgK [Desulfitobacterium dichloroeliminans]AGA70321.1 flagellar hook-associated protein FlgK [Desulfitobacterium dichloroeliminans LMG P-21439]
MRSTFSGLELARRALESQQTALDTTGHNIANANSKGYTRQVVNLQATVPSSIPSMGHNLSIGTGVTVQGIERARDIFVDRQYRWENTKQSYWSARQDNLNKVEGLLNEPADNSFSNDMDKFWNAWSELSKNPENLGSRSVLLERAETLAGTFHHIDQQLTEMQKGLDSSVRVQINQINVAAKQIQELNFQIKRAEVAGDNPNDLRDKRDTLVDELSQMVNVRVVESRDATFKDREVNIFKVYIGDDKVVNNILVDDTTAYQLAEPVMAGADGLPFAEVRWDAGHPHLAGNTVSLGDKMGKLQSDLLLRGTGYNLGAGESKDDAYLSYLRRKYDDLAAGIAEAVNLIHSTGIARGITPPATVPDFFDTSVGTITAANISVNTALTIDPWKIATGETTYGDGGIAQDISSLSSGWTAPALGGTPPATISAASFGDFYGSSISELGVDVQQATRMAEGQAVLVNHMFNQRESLSGVSLDEEMTNLVRFQKSYSAAARIVTMLDDMLNTIVNGMGITR